MLERMNIGIAGSNPDRSMDLWPRFLFVLLPMIYLVSWTVTWVSLLIGWLFSSRGLLGCDAV